jgi:hypothetical protein
MLLLIISFLCPVARFIVYEDEHVAKRERHARESKLIPKRWNAKVPKPEIFRNVEREEASRGIANLFHHRRLGVLMRGMIPKESVDLPRHPMSEDESVIESTNNGEEAQMGTTVFTLPMELMAMIFENFDDVAALTNVLPFVSTDFDTMIQNNPRLTSLTFQCGSMAGGGLAGHEVREILERNAPTVRCVAIRGSDRANFDFVITDLPFVIFKSMRECRFRRLTQVVIEGDFCPRVTVHFLELLRNGHLWELRTLKFCPEKSLNPLQLKGWILPHLLSLEVGAGREYWYLSDGEYVAPYFECIANLREFNLCWDVGPIQQANVRAHVSSFSQLPHPTNTLLDKCGLADCVQKLKLTVPRDVVPWMPSRSNLKLSMLRQVWPHVSELTVPFHAIESDEDMGCLREKFTSMRRLVVKFPHLQESPDGAVEELMTSLGRVLGDEWELTEEEVGPDASDRTVVGKYREP